MKGKFNYHFTDYQKQVFEKFPEDKAGIEKCVKNCPVTTTPKVPKTPFEVIVGNGSYHISNPEVTSYDVNEKALPGFKDPVIKKDVNSITDLIFEYSKIYDGYEGMCHFIFLKNKEKANEK